ncbi:hypothetical protein HII36_22080 [Nonomuraea sp. NN258]|uniref:hypothetical protein n=1 Tax=Nonomuraea antri TaxID=2730852 RepID=UPI001567EE13|nr:hypothetical protein [Nonomuraea antri]NRQ34516.1 hypothetical protein [Nonomuraea antri]
MKHLRSPARAAAVVVILFSMFAVSTSAQATAGRKGTDEPAVGAMAWTPTLTPFDSTRERVYRNLSGTARNYWLTFCRAGYLCVAAGQGDGLHTVYHLYYCGERSLRNFIDAGAVRNRQTDEAVARLKDISRVTKREIPADGAIHGVDWRPIYYLDPC